MSIGLFSDDYVGPLASGKGWADLCTAVGDGTSELQKFCDQGFSEDPDALRKSLTEFLIAKGYLPDDVRDTLVNLAKMLENVQGIAIASDSLVVEDDEEEDSAEKGFDLPTAKVSRATLSYVELEKTDDKCTLEGELQKALTEMLSRPVLCIDFDGTLVKPDPDNPTAVGPFLDGAIDALRDLSRDFDIWLFTARDNFAPIWQALAANNASAYVTEVTNVKPQDATQFVDDRGNTFAGEWTPAFIEAVRSFQPYWKATRRARVLFVKRSYDSIQYNVPAKYLGPILAIPVDDADWALKGRDMHPHVTVLWGLTDANEEAVKAILKGFAAAREERKPATAVDYQELKGAVKDGDCREVFVEGGVSGDLGCCNDYERLTPETQRFDCRNCDEFTAPGEAGPLAPRVGLDRLAVFPPGDDGEPLYIRVVSGTLAELHSALKSALDPAETWPDYIPHICVGYLKPGAGAKYAGKPYPLENQAITLTDLVLSRKDNTVIPLAKRKADAIRIDPAYTSPALKAAEEKLAEVIKKVFQRQKDRAKEKAGRLLKVHAGMIRALIDDGLAKVAQRISATVGVRKPSDKGPEGGRTEVQSLIFMPKDAWTKDEVRTWLKEHDYKTEIEETDSSYRARQEDPDKYDRIRTIPFKGAKKGMGGAEFYKQDEEDEQDDDAVNIADEIMASLQELFGDITDDGLEPLEDAALAGVEKGARDLRLTDDDMISSLNEGARDWAGDRAAELVGMRRLDDGSIVENPNAKWAITDTTRDDLRRIISNGFTKETPMPDLIKQIGDAGAFSDSRAEMIAQTEVAFAQVHANYDVWKASGVVDGSTWQLSVDHVPGCDCDLNAGVTVAIGEDFPSGDDMPPAHPRCQCSLVASMQKVLKYSDTQARDDHGRWVTEYEGWLTKKGKWIRVSTDHATTAKRHGLDTGPGDTPSERAINAGHIRVSGDFQVYNGDDKEDIHFNARAGDQNVISHIRDAVAHSAGNHRIYIELEPRHGEDESKRKNGVFDNAGDADKWLARQSRAAKGAGSATTAGWDESKHPRAPAGTAEGGEFTSGGGTPADREKHLRQGTQHVTSAKLLGKKHVAVATKIQFDDGTKAVFKPHEGEGDIVGHRGEDFTPGFQTEREVGAWEVAKLVNMQDMVAPTVDAKIKNLPEVEHEGKTIGGQGKTTRGALMDFEPGRQAAGVRQRYGDDADDVARAAAFDYVIGNTDRHSGNWLVEKGGAMHLIDHGYSFPDGDYNAYNEDFIIRACKSERSGKIGPPARYAAPYVANKRAIVGALRKVGLQERAIRGVKERIGYLSTMKGWDKLPGTWGGSYPK
jgi:hypothetical protein